MRPDQLGGVWLPTCLAPKPGAPAQSPCQVPGSSCGLSLCLLWEAALLYGRWGVSEGGGLRDLWALGGSLALRPRAVRGPPAALSRAQPCRPLPWPLTTTAGSPSLQCFVFQPSEWPREVSMAGSPPSQGRPVLAPGQQSAPCCC